MEGADVLAAGADPQLEYAVEGRRSDGVDFRFSEARTDDYAVRFAAVNANLLDVAAGSALPYVSAGQIWRNTVAAVDLDRNG